MGNTYFLGANSQKGFYSLYGGFCADAGDRLSIIKGGPGTGKSGFMKKIAAEAEKRGYEVERVLCSGAPDSLDGVYIPALKRGWVDGTAPHVTEPQHFGIDGDYIELGSFCALPIDDKDGKIARLYERYRQMYSEAYGFIAAAESVGKSCTPTMIDPGNEAKLRRRVEALIEHHGTASVRGKRRLRFYRALSSKGDIRLSGEIEKLCSRIIRIEDEWGTADKALHAAADAAWRLGHEHIISLSPAAPEMYEAVLLPGLDLAFTCEAFTFDTVQCIYPESDADKEKLKEGRRLVREGMKMKEKLSSFALERLYEANRLHDELEKYYIEKMDFAALDEFTEGYIEKLFG